jgi:hypothetical protein
MLLAAALLLPHLAGAPPAGAVHLPVPSVEYRTNIASATRKPWVTANGWRLDREGDKVFFYNAPGRAAALAAAEAFAHGREAFIHTDAEGTSAFERMLAYLKSLAPGPGAPLTDFALIDDGSAATGELMNRLALQNYQFRVDPHGIELKQPRPPVSDKDRLVRLFGSDVVLARLTGDSAHVRLHLINYGERPVRALRVRVRGRYARAPAGVTDDDITAAAIEFTVPEIADYLAIDLEPVR